MTRAERIKKKNEQFRAMTVAQKRVAMAKDALEWLKEGALIARQGLYIRPLDSDLRLDDVACDAGGDTQARDVVLGPCEVCAKGALLIAKAVRFDEVTVRELADYGGEDLLEDEFGKDNIDTIELAFEQAPWRNSDLNWFEAYPEPADRMKAILENVVRNNGTFQYNEVQAP